MTETMGSASSCRMPTTDSTCPSTTQTSHMIDSKSVNLIPQKCRCLRTTQAAP